MAASELVFPLVPRHRLIGLSFGAMHSARRGMGSDVAGSRPYAPGDDIDAIDWNASAKLSAAHAADEFIVRERFAEEAPRVVVICDRRPAMSLFPGEFPWLSKPEATRQAVELVVESTLHARGFVGYLDLGDLEDPDGEGREKEPFWWPPRMQHAFWEIREERLSRPSFHAPEDNLVRAFDYLVEVRNSVPAGTFLFVLSDFIVVPPIEAWLRALGRRWDIVPVIVQDPLWEQSFPDVASLVVPLADPRTGKVAPVRLTRNEADRRRVDNELRLAGVVREFEALGLDPLVLGSHEREDVFQAFLSWADGRAYRRGRA
jgi:uncharacterized protein (DUF58 family)